MIRFINFIEYISRLLGYLAAMMILSSVLITCQMIFVRFALNQSTVWQTETVIFLSIGATLLGLPYVQILKGHVNVDLIPLMLPPKARRVLLAFSYLMSIAVIAIMLFYGYELWHFALERNWKTQSVNAIPLWIPYFALPVGFGVFMCQLFCDMLKDVFGVGQA